MPIITIEEKYFMEALIVNMSIEFVTIIFFLAILILLSKIENIIIKEDSRSYKYIAGGISLMALMSLMDIFYMQGFFDTIPFMAAEIFFRVSVWIGNIIGIVFLLNGLSNWLPISRTYRRITQENLVRFDIVKKIDQLLNVESRIYQVIKSAVNHIVNDFELDSGAVYLFTQSKESAKLINISHTTKDLEDVLKKIEADINFQSMKNDNENLTRYILEQIDNEIDRPVIIHKLRHNDKTFGLVLLWGNKSKETTQEIEKVVKVSFDLIISRVRQRISKLKDSFNQTNERVNLETVKMLNDNHSIKSVMVTLFQSIKKIMNVSFMSVVEINDNKTINRFSIGSSNTVLQEQYIRIPLNTGVLGHVRNYNNFYYDKNIDNLSYDTFEEIYTSDNAQSIVAIPIKQNENCQGMIVLSSKNQSGFKIKDIKILNTISNILAVFLFKEEKHELGNSQSLTALNTFNFAETFNRSKNESIIINSATKYLFETLKPSVIRIFLFDDDKLFGSSKTLLYEKDIDVVTPGKGSLILSMLSLHNLASQSEEITLYGTELNNKISEVESSQVLCKDIKSGMIIPLRTGLNTVGLISMGNVGNRIYSESDKEIGKIISGKISEVLLANLLENRIDKHIKKLNLQISKNNQELEIPERLTGTIDYEDEKILT